MSVTRSESRPVHGGRIVTDWLSDEHECDTCGTSWASGAVAILGDRTLVRMEPSAACYDGTTFDEQAVYARILEALRPGEPVPGPYDADDNLTDYKALIEALGYTFAEGVHE